MDTTDDNVNQFDALAAIVVDEQGEIDLLLPQEYPEDPYHPIYFLMAIYHKCQHDPKFYESIMEWVRQEAEAKKQRH